MCFEQIKTILESISYGAASLGFLLAAYTYWNDKSTNRKFKIIDNYLKCSDHYIDLLKLTLEHPKAKFFEYSTISPIVKRAGINTHKATMYLILFLTLEQGHFLHTEAKLNEDPHLWDVWDDTLDDWIKNPEFKKAWDALNFTTYPKFRKRIEDGFKKLDTHINSLK